MRKFLPAVVILALASAPAMAQSPSAQAAPATEAEQKTVKKLACKRNEVSGSRLGAGSSKVCKEVEVPAKEQKQAPSGNHGH